MILRKPYAFLIKYFKLINFIVCLLAIYIAYKSYTISSFFNEYILNNYAGNYYPGFYNSYISPITFLVLITILLCISGVLLLFIYKKKPIKMYAVSIVYYILLFIFFVFIKNVMINLENVLLNAESARIYRDLSILVIVPQIYLIFMYLFRGLGLNIKKFNFEQDLKDLQIEEQDNEEVEIVFKNKNLNIKRNINRFYREFKYYLKENKFILAIIIIIFIGLIGYFIYRSFPEIIDRKYIQGETFIINNLTYKIEDSIITNLDYNGNILNKDKYFLVIKLNIKNETTTNIAVDYNNFTLELKDSYVYPSLDKGQYFIDYAKDKYNKEIKANNSEIISLVYEINELDLRKSYTIKIPNGTTFADNIIVARHNYITISPIVINKVNSEIIVDEGQEIDFSNSNLGNTKITINNSEITDKYIYNYESCINEKCTTYKDLISLNYNSNNTLIVMDYKYEFDYNMAYFSNTTSFNSFIKSFLKVKYKNNDNEYKYSNINNITPSRLTNKIVIETTNKIKNSEEVFLSIIIRNKEYLIKLKNNQN